MSTQQVVFAEFKAQQQITYVKQGLLLQQESNQQYPISYIMNAGTISIQSVKLNTNMTYFTELFLDLDETIFESSQKVLKEDREDVDENLVLSSVFIPSFATKSGENILKYKKSDTFQPDYIIVTESDRFKQNQLQEQDKIKEIQMSNSSYQFNTSHNKNYGAENSTKENYKKEEVIDIQNSDNQVFAEQNSQRQPQQNQKRKLQIQEQRQCFTSKHEKYSNLSNRVMKQDEISSLKDQIRLIKTNELDQISQRSQITQSQDKVIKKPYFRFQFETEKSNNENISSNKKSKPNLDFIDKIFKCFDNKQLMSKIADLLFKFRIRKRKEYQTQIGLDSQIKQIIDEQVDNSIDFSKFYDEILLLKKAIMMILTTEQFASLKLVGCSEQFQHQKISQKNLNRTNHFEEQLEVCLSTNKQINYAKQFIEKCSNNDNLSQIDQRIYSSIIIN
ncbi:hypothetical protein ABPG73_021160 [Tetrahymena malaccensis]